MSFVLMLIMSLSVFAANGRDGILFIKSDYCVCNDGKAISFGNCSSFCDQRNTQGADLLFASFNVAENKKYSSVAEWCSKKSPWDFRNPKCVMNFVDEAGNKADIGVNVTNNTVTADVSGISFDKTYVFTLVESVSKGKSNSAQVIKFNSDYNYPLPVAVSALTQFTCISKPLQKKFHFYFAPFIAPEPQRTDSTFVCHDTAKYGDRDDATFPRLEEVRAQINMWPNTSPLFYDNNGNGYLDIHDAIRIQVKRFGGTIPAGSELFTYFNLPGNEANYTQSGASKSSRSYLLKPFVDQATYYAYCPTEEHYSSAAPLFKALGEVIGVPTEGLYAGMEIGDNQDLILLNETNIKAVWFYVKDGRVKVPNDSTVSRETIYFYYPLDKVDPYVKKSYQRIYQVKSAEELGMASAQAYPAHDRRIGCIPKN